MHRSVPRTTYPERRPRRVSITIGIATVAMLLSACGLVAAFVPPLSVGDPLGVDGQVVTAALDGGGLAPQATSHLDETRSFDVPDLDEDLRGFSLAGFHTDAGLESVVTLAGPLGTTASDHPEAFTVTRAVVEGTLQDDANGAVTFTRDIALSLAFSRADCGVDACEYAYAGTDTLDDALSVELTDRDDLERLVSILMLRETETPNRGTFRVAIEIESDTSIAGFTATFTLTSDGSTIRLGG